jgi:hypothetical protein
LSWIDEIFKRYQTKRIDELLTKYRKKNSERESFKKVKLRKTREKEREKNLSHMFTFILIAFQLLEFFLIRNSVFIPNLSRHFLKMNYANWESHLHLNLWSFLLSLSNVCRKKIWWDKICCFTTFFMMISYSRKFFARIKEIFFTYQSLFEWC